MPGSEVSVVMATRNRRQRVMSTISRLLALPDRPSVIVVDNASQDGTAEAVSEAFADVKVLPLQHNLGAAGRTIGVRAATTPYVAFADDDSWWAPGALTRAADHFDAAPRLGLLAGKILVGDEQRLDPTCGAMADSPLPGRADLPGPAILGFVACGAVVRRQAFLEVGGFSPLLFIQGEETVLAQDLAAAGWDLAYADDLLAYHHPVPAGDRGDRRRLAARNRLVSVWLRRRWPAAVRATGRMLRQTADPDVRRGVIDALRLAPTLAAARRPLPAYVERLAARLDATEPGRPDGRR